MLVMQWYFADPRSQSTDKHDIQEVFPEYSGSDIGRLDILHLQHTPLPR